MSTRLMLSACVSLTLVAGCAHDFFFAAPEPLKRVPVQDAQAILQTLNEKPKPRPTTLAQPAIGVRPATPEWVTRLAKPAAAPASVPERAAAVEPRETPLAAALPAPVAALVPPAVLAAAPAATAAPLPAPAVAVAPRPKPVVAPVDVAPAPDESQVRTLLESWRTAWETGDASRYLAFYDNAFTGQARSRREWERQRRQRLANGGIKVAMYQVQVGFLGDAEADVRFVQAYSSGRHADHGEKRMKLRREAAGWKIVQESWTEAPPPQ